MRMRSKPASFSRGFASTHSRPSFVAGLRQLERLVDVGRARRAAPPASSRARASAPHRDLVQVRVVDPDPLAVADDQLSAA